MLSFVAALSVAGAALAQEPPTVPPLGPDDDGPFSQAAIEQHLRDASDWLETSLIDYESARFREVRAVIISPRARGQRQVYLGLCGMVNAKNRMGGYTGFEPFFFAPTAPQRIDRDIGFWATEVCKTVSPVNAEDYSARLRPEE